MIAPPIKSTHESTWLLSGQLSADSAVRSIPVSSSPFLVGRHANAARRVAEALGLGELSYQKRSWGPAVTVIVGADLRDRADPSTFPSATVSRETGVPASATP